MKERAKKNKIGTILLEHVRNNAKEYLIIGLIFLAGIVFGIIFINQAKDTTKTEITNYITNFKDALQGENKIDKGTLLTQSITKNVILGIALWFVGSTVIGIPIVYAIVAYRGFCIGYTISAAIAVLGNKSGILFILLSIFCQNILFIPALLAISVSGIKMYQSIVKNKQKENIKIEMVRHTIFSTIIIIILTISSLIEVYISTNLLQGLIQYL